jgi:hypothetical protein
MVSALLSSRGDAATVGVIENPQSSFIITAVQMLEILKK